jgi:radical SAM superfamily enzyme YgiQ (UPF0313 family)
MPLHNLPIPRRDLLNPRKYITRNTIQASRGCPANCDFCVIPKVWGRAFHHRPIEEVVSEIKQMKTKEILFLDPSLTADTEYAKSLFNALIPLRIRWAGLSTVKIGENNELLKLASASGCTGILIGFESVWQKCLDESSKSFGKVSKYKEIIKKLHDYGIAVLGCFMFGFDNDDNSVFERTVEFANSSKIDIIRYAVYTPFPGTMKYKELFDQGRIIENDWGFYDNEHVVFKPAMMTPDELQEGLYKAWKQSYSVSSIFKRLRGLKPFYWESFLANCGFKYYAQNLEYVHANIGKAF